MGSGNTLGMTGIGSGLKDWFMPLANAAPAPIIAMPLAWMRACSTCIRCIARLYSYGSIEKAGTEKNSNPRKIVKDRMGHLLYDVSLAYQREGIQCPN